MRYDSGGYVDTTAPKTWTGRQVVAPVAELTATGMMFSNRTAATLQAAANTVTKTAHGFAANTQIGFFSVTTTTGLTKGARYFVVNPTANTFQVALTSGGAAVDLTGADGTCIYGAEDTDQVAGAGQEQWQLQTSAGTISALYASSVGLRTRVDVRQDGITAGHRLMKYGFPCVDFDIDTDGNMFIDDVSVRPSMAWVVGDAGQPSVGIRIGVSRILMQRQLSLTARNTGVGGLIVEYQSTGLQLFDDTVGGGPQRAIFQHGAAGTARFSFPNGVVTEGTTADGMGLTQTNQNGAQRTWRISPIQTGVANDRWTLRDMTAGVDRIMILPTGEVCIPASDIVIQTAGKGIMQPSAETSTSRRLILHDNGTVTCS